MSRALDRPGPDVSGTELRRELRRELRTWVAAWAGRPVVALEKVSSLAAPRHKAAAFRARLADGRVVKVRVLRDAPTADRVVGVLDRLSHPAFPRVLAQDGRMLVLEWIEGRVLGGGRVPAPLLRPAAELLAVLHRTPLSEASPFEPFARFTHVDLPRRLEERPGRFIRRLVDAGSLEAETGVRLEQTLCALAPKAPAIGVVHGDLCGENLVVDATGRVRSIDNEALGVDALDGDLARSLYRWSLPEEGRAGLLDAYAEYRPIESFLAHQGYWSAVACLASAAHRVGAPPEVARVPLQHLERLLEGDLLAAS